MKPFHAPISGTYNELASPRESGNVVALLSGNADGDNNNRQDHFLLEAGRTSLTDRIANLAKQGRSFDVVNLLETALNRSDERTVGKVAKIALDAYSHMDDGDAKNVLKDVLADWGMDADNHPRAPHPSFTAPSTPRP